MRCEPICWVGLGHFVCHVISGYRMKCLLFVYLLTACSQPPSVDHATVDEGTNTVGSTRTYSCTDKGYYLQGSGLINCQPNVTWTNKNFTCSGKSMLFLVAWLKMFAKCRTYLGWSCIGWCRLPFFKCAYIHCGQSTRQRAMLARRSASDQKFIFGGSNAGCSWLFYLGNALEACFVLFGSSICKKSFILGIRDYMFLNWHYSIRQSKNRRYKSSKNIWNVEKYQKLYFKLLVF